MKIEDDEIHLQRTIYWLESACKNGNGGVSSHYSTMQGRWLKPFPETTGYIIPTLFDYSYFINEKKYFNLAIQLTDWLCDVQLENGACIQGHYYKEEKKPVPIVFNTGQNILGFERAYQETNNEKYLKSAIKAGDFLVNSTDENGIWDKNLHRNLKHTINSRTSLALLKLYQIRKNENYSEIAHKNLDWTVKQQTKNGWFQHGTSRHNGLPNTHFLSYTCEGLVESYKMTGNQSYFDAAFKTAEKMLRIFEIRKMLYTFWDEKWKNCGKYFKWTKGRFVCLSGNIQISIVWMQLYELTGDIRFLNAAFKMLDYVKTLQNIQTSKTGVKGGIKGSFPLYGSYSMLMYPNWAAKFFADALMLKIQLQSKINDSSNSR